MGIGTLSIFTWGCPAQWGVAEYIFDTDKDSITSCTSMMSILSKLIRNEKSLHIVVLVLDSIVDKYRGKPQNSACYECYQKCYSEKLEFFNCKCEEYDYRTLVEKEAEFIREVIRCICEKEGNLKWNEIEDKIKIVVGPAVGSPGGVWSFNGDARDFLAISLYRLANLVMEQPIDKIILDLTHGVNFMPSETLHLAHLIASLSLIRHECIDNVRIEAYNADPYPPGSNTTPRLNVNLVYRYDIRTVYMLHRVPQYIIKQRTKVEEGLKNKLCDINSIMNSIRYVISSFYYPTPLALCEICNSNNIPDKIDEKLKQAIELWYSNIIVKDRTIIRPLRINPDAIYLAYLAYGLCTTIRELTKGFHPDLTSLDKLAKIYGALNENFEYLIKHEVSRIKESLEDVKLEGECILLSNIYREEGKYSKEDNEKRKQVQRPDTRIMIAHAGLQKEFVKICPDKTLRYTQNAEEILRSSGLLLSLSSD